jgi:hypothetical protein
MKSKNNDESDNTPVIEGGIVAEGTEKERMISGEDAVSINYIYLFIIHE